MGDEQSAVFNVAGREIGPGRPALIVAELSANHNNSLEKARDIIRAAADSGADAVKLQTYTADTLTIDCDNDYFRIKGGTLWDGKTLHQLYGEAYTPWEWHEPLKKLAEDLGLIFFSTPFDPTAVDFLEDLGVPCHKVASFEMIDVPLIKKIASTGKPIIMSTGMSTLEEISEAVEAALSGGASGLALLKCISAYPAPAEEMNLRVIPDLARRFGVPAGLSDHTMGEVAALGAVALGACVIEKHFIVSRQDKGPDSEFSMEPAELRAMVDKLRLLEKAIGEVQYGPSGAEKSSVLFRRSLFVTADIQKGNVFSTNNLRSIRPGNGLPPKHLPDILGKIATCDIKRGTPLDWDMVEEKH